MSKRYDKYSTRSRVTLRDLAKATGLSVSTVSEVLSADPEVAGRYSQDASRRVQAAAAKLGYVPSQAARALRRGRSGLVGFILTETIGSHVFSEIVRCCDNALRQRGYWQRFASVDGDADSESRQLSQLRSEHVEGLIVGPVFDEAHLRQHLTFFTGALPCVTFGTPSNSGFDEVGTDSAGVWRDTINTLVGYGHRRIGQLAPPLHYAPPHAVLPWVIQPMIDAKVYDPRWVIPYPFGCRSFEQSYGIALEIAERWTQSPPARRPTAFVCQNDNIAMTAMAAFRSLGIRIPHDVSFIGRDDLPHLPYLSPPLSSVRDDPHAIADFCVERLLLRINGSTEPAVSKLLPARLIIRDSIRRLENPT